MKTKVRFFAAMVIAMAALALSGCGVNSANDKAETTTAADSGAEATSDGGTAIVTNSAAESASEAKTDEADQELQNSGYPDNILIANEDYSILDDEYNTVMGNTEYTRNAILNITFLDTLKDAPDNAWDASAAQDGSVMAWVADSSDGEHYDLYVAGEGGVTANPVSAGLFALYENVESIEFNDCFYTDIVENMRGMFDFCRQLKTLDVSGFHTSSATSMAEMFGSCESLETIDVSGFDTSNVTSMKGMFYGCHSVKTLDVTGFDTSNVTDMMEMFEECRTLETLDLSNFDTSQTDDMAGMFAGCVNLEYLDLSSFDTSAVRRFSSMFRNCEKLKSADISSFTTDSLTTAARMFEGCSSLENAEQYREQLNLSSDVDTEDMLSGTP